ncbi:MAG TPA: hypothetical protein VFQ25_00400 [Ktedonobacterales bacterium]|nr:hypothetical protein [Ktedonobacterales bacterium]
MTGSIPPNLILSLVFGVGQIVVGGWLAWYGLAPARWRQWRAVLAGAAGVWFLVSGVCELIVSGMELNRGLGGGPSDAVFTQTRALADGALFAATGALAIGLAVYFIARAVMGRRGSSQVESERGR